MKLRSGYAFPSSQASSCLTLIVARHEDKHEQVRGLYRTEVAPENRTGR